MPFSDPKWPICPEQIFLVQTSIITFIYLLALFIVQNFKKKTIQRIQSYKDVQFLGPNENFFRKPVNEPCSFHSCLSTCQKLKWDINLLVKYWLLKNTEISLAVQTWEPDFCQACSFRRMLMNHKNFHLTQIPDKTNKAIFLKSLKTLSLSHFWPFLVIFAQWGFFPKNPTLSHTTICGSLTAC